MTSISPIGHTNPETDTSVTASVTASASATVTMTVLMNATTTVITTNENSASSATRAITPIEARAVGWTKTSPEIVGITRAKNQRQKKNSRARERGSAAKLQPV